MYFAAFASAPGSAGYDGQEGLKLFQKRCLGFRVEAVFGQVSKRGTASPTVDNHSMSRETQVKNLFARIGRKAACLPMHLWFADLVRA